MPTDPDQKPKPRLPPVVRDAPAYTPSLGHGYSRDDFNDFFEDPSNAADFAPWLAANPDRAIELKQLFWVYGRDGNFDDIIDQLLAGGYTSPGAIDTSGGRRGGGGGGGAPTADDYANAEAIVRNMIGVLGGQGFTDEAIVGLAKTVVDGNWSNERLTDYLVGGIAGNSGPGEIENNIKAIKQAAADQLISVSDETAREWATRIASNEMTLDTVGMTLRTKATERYAWAAAGIEAGVSVRNMLLPSRDLIAQQLEKPPESIDLMDQQWMDMIQTVDEKSGQVRAATDSEIIMRTRKKDEFINTRTSAVMGNNLVQTIRDYFGG